MADPSIRDETDAPDLRIERIPRPTGARCQSDQRTVFLATDGRFITLGRGEVEFSGQTIESIRAQNLAGWRVILSDSPYARHAPEPSRREAHGGATDGQWESAIAAFRKGCSN